VSHPEKEIGEQEKIKIPSSLWSNTLSLCVGVWGVGSMTQDCQNFKLS